MQNPEIVLFVRKQFGIIICLSFVLPIVVLVGDYVWDTFHNTDQVDSMCVPLTCTDAFGCGGCALPVIGDTSTLMHYEILSKPGLAIVYLGTVPGGPKEFNGVNYTHIYWEYGPGFNLPKWGDTLTGEESGTVLTVPDNKRRRWWL